MSVTYSRLPEQYVVAYGKWGLRGPRNIMEDSVVVVRKKGGKFKNEWVGQFIYEDGDYIVTTIGKCVNCNMGFYECQYWNCASEDFLDLGMHWDIK